MYQVFNVWLAEEELEQMKLYLNFLQESLTDFEQKLEKKYTIEDLTRISEADGYSPQLTEYNNYLDTFASLLGDFPRRHFNSFIINWYSFIEVTLLGLCDDLNLETTSSTSKKKKSGIFLTKELLGNENILFEDRYWKELDLIRKTRNNIVHHNGSFSLYYNKIESSKLLGPFVFQGEEYFVEAEGNLYKYLLANELIRIYKKAYILPKIDYCYHLVEFGKILLFDIFKKAKLI